MRQHVCLTHLNYRVPRYLIVSGRQLLVLLLGILAGLVLYQRAAPWVILDPVSGAPGPLSLALTAAWPAALPWVPWLHLALGGLPLALVVLGILGHWPTRLAAEIRYQRLPKRTSYRAAHTTPPKTPRRFP